MVVRFWSEGCVLSHLVGLLRIRFGSMVLTQSCEYVELLVC